VGAGSVTHASLDFRNDGRRAVLPDGTSAVTIGQRWLTPEGHILGCDELRLNELAALPQLLPHVIRVNRMVRAELVLYAPVEPGSYRIEVLAHQHGHGWLDGPTGPRALVADIEVVDGPVGGAVRD
jgi:hypothetical protein